MVDLGQALSGAGECRRSLERVDHYQWTLLTDMFEKRVRCCLHSHIEVFAMLRKVRVVHEPSQARMNGKRVPVTPTHLPLLHSYRDFCVLGARRKMCAIRPARRQAPTRTTSSGHGSTPSPPALNNKCVMSSCAKPQRKNCLSKSG